MAKQFSCIVLDGWKLSIRDGGSNNREYVRKRGGVHKNAVCVRGRRGRLKQFWCDALNE